MQQQDGLRRKDYYELVTASLLHRQPGVKFQGMMREQEILHGLAHLMTVELLNTKNEQ